MERRKGGWRSSIGRGGYGPELWKAIKKEWDPFISKTSFELVMGGRLQGKVAKRIDGQGGV
ncbi:hypothetical protein CK203_017944 [Vitis vinifera]|uniref:Uncharacterized protein n=1 Tax=Vitis vinifera TaxID=29760 RepID=A0A438JW24_VITVI|nr:hypothetical protein CK203_017944 [Vitis vinifera]